MAYAMYLHKVLAGKNLHLVFPFPGLYCGFLPLTNLKKVRVLLKGRFKKKERARSWRSLAELTSFSFNNISYYFL